MTTRWLAAVLLALLPHLANARCAPFEDSPNYYAMVVSYSLADPAGPYLVWHCYATRLGQVPERTRHCIHAPWSAIDLRRLGDRADTIRSAADPVVAWHASYKRHVGEARSARCAQLLGVK